MKLKNKLCFSIFFYLMVCKKKNHSFYYFFSYVFFWYGFSRSLILLAEGNFMSEHVIDFPQKKTLMKQCMVSNTDSIRVPYVCVGGRGQLQKEVQRRKDTRYLNRKIILSSVLAFPKIILFFTDSIKKKKRRSLRMQQNFTGNLI